MLLRFSLIMLLLLQFPALSFGKLLLVDGGLDGRVTVKRVVTFSSDRDLEQLTYNFSIPDSYETSGGKQRISVFQVALNPMPQESEDLTDRFGNRFRKLSWRNVTGNIQATISFTAAIETSLKPRTSRSPFPLLHVPQSEEQFLKSTALVQSDAKQIRELAERLTASAVSEQAAVDSIITYVADAMTYSFNPKQYDALYGLNSASGNCQNFSHLTLALLRAVGIPARQVVGLTLKEKWKIPIDRDGSSLVQSMGEGLHAWVEIYYPDLGWLSCDPQQSRLFTSTRHIKLGHGLDASDVQEFWSALPNLPAMSENITATYDTDRVNLHLLQALDNPRRYLAAADVSFAGELSTPHSTQPSVKLLPPKPGKPQAPNLEPVRPFINYSAARSNSFSTAHPENIQPLPAKPASKGGARLEFGNTEFPAMVETYLVEGNTGRRNMERETAEYVTSRHLYAQSFRLDEKMNLKDVSLAMRRFGGDGLVYLDVVADSHGKPGLEGVRSTPVYLEKLPRRPGYYWVDFTFPPGTVLKTGKYWIVLRHSGETVMNWFYTPGIVTGEPGGSRSTALGWKWEDVLAWEFVYRVRGTRE